MAAAPIPYGITADTGGHIAYVLHAAAAQAGVAGVQGVIIATRLFADPALGDRYAAPSEQISDRVVIHRIATPCRAYLEKEALAAELPAFTDAFCSYLAALPRLPDVIHAHFADAAAVARMARTRFGIPFVYTPHALARDKIGGGGTASAARIEAEKCALAEADAVIVSTTDEAQRQVAAYGVIPDGRVNVLPPGVPEHPFVMQGGPVAGGLHEFLDDPDLPIVLAVARPVRKKNLSALIHAYATTPGLAARANLVIVAGQNGPLASAEERAVREEMRAARDHHGLGRRVALPPRHGPGDVAALYRRAARGGVFVNPALHEPFGLTLIEAAAAGVPVVATCRGGPADIVARLGHGLLVDPQDHAAIGAACLRLLEEPRLHRRFAEAGRRNVVAYAWPEHARRSIEIYRTLRRPKMLVSDIDETLTGCPASAAAFAEWGASRTVPFVVATGRSFDDARDVLKRWRLPTPDAFIVDVGTRIMLPEGEGWRACPHYADHLDRDWDRAAIAAVLAPLNLSSQPPDTDGPHKISYFGTAADAAAIRTALAGSGLAARVVHSHGRLIDVLPQQGGKAAAVAAYAEARGIALADCVAAGDSGNDADMLESCGHAIIVANAGIELAELGPRPGLRRVEGRHAAGVLEGLAALGLVAPAP